MSSPEVSVVMSVYNSGATLPATLKSVLDQDDCDLEFIVVDDGSTDASGRLLDDWAATDPRLKVMHQSNAGLTRALILGCRNAQGKYIARQDAGDLSLPGRLRNQLAAFRQDPGLAFVSCRTRYVEGSGAFLFEGAGTGVAREPRDVIDLEQAHGMRDGPSHHGSVMFLKDAYESAGGYRPQFYFGQDWDLWYRLAAHGRFQLLDDILYEATIGVGDISAGNKDLQEQLAALSLACLKLRAHRHDESKLLEQAAAIRPRPGRKSRMRIARGAYFLGECLRSNGDPSRAKKYLLEAVRSNPLHAKAWVRLAQIALGSRPAGPQ